MTALKRFVSLTLIFGFGLIAGIDVANATSVCDSLSGNLVGNCGFETGSFTSWTLSGNDVPLQENSLYGVEGIDPLDGISPNSGNSQAFFGDLVANVTVLSQTLSTSSGEMYTVSWHLAQDTSATSSFPNVLIVSFGGVSLVSQTDVPVQGYTDYSFSVEATSPSSLLTFAVGNDLGQFLLDDVSVVRQSESVTPLPAALPLFAGGLGVVGLLARRRKRNNATAEDSSRSR
jgi:hypothetical protein